MLPEPKPDRKMLRMEFVEHEIKKLPVEDRPSINTRISYVLETTGNIQKDFRIWLSKIDVGADILKRDHVVFHDLLTEKHQLIASSIAAEFMSKHGEYRGKYAPIVAAYGPHIAIRFQKIKEKR